MGPWALLAIWGSKHPPIACNAGFHVGRTGAVVLRPGFREGGLMDEVGLKWLASAALVAAVTVITVFVVGGEDEHTDATSAADLQSGEINDSRTAVANRPDKSDRPGWSRKPERLYKRGGPGWALDHRGLVMPGGEGWMMPPGFDHDGEGWMGRWGGEMGPGGMGSWFGDRMFGPSVMPGHGGPMMPGRGMCGMCGMGMGGMGMDGMAMGGMGMGGMGMGGMGMGSWRGDLLEEASEILEDLFEDLFQKASEDLADLFEEPVADLEGLLMDAAAELVEDQFGLVVDEMADRVVSEVIERLVGEEAAQAQ